jgi:hypothetical protein
MDHRSIPAEVARDKRRTQGGSSRASAITYRTPHSNEAGDAGGHYPTHEAETARGCGIHADPDYHRKARLSSAKIIPV